MLVGMQAGTTILEISLTVPQKIGQNKQKRKAHQKLDIVLPEDPAIPLLGIYPELFKGVIRTHAHPYS